MTSEQYLRLGLPAPDRDWAADDMKRAERALAALAAKGYGQLPRYESERSGAVFARMTSPRNLDLFRERSLPIAARLPLAADYLQASNGILKVYLAGLLEKGVRDRDVVELMGALLRSVAVTLELVDEFTPTIGPGDPSRAQGLEQVKRGLASIVAGNLQTLTEADTYGPDALDALAGSMQETFPAIVPRLPPGSRTETLLRLETMGDDPALEALRPRLRDLHAKVKAAVEGGEPTPPTGVED